MKKLFLLLMFITFVIGSMNAQDTLTALNVPGDTVSVANAGNWETIGMYRLQVSQSRSIQHKLKIPGLSGVDVRITFSPSDPFGSTIVWQPINFADSAYRAYYFTADDYYAVAVAVRTTDPCNQVGVYTQTLSISMPNYQEAIGSNVEFVCTPTGTTVGIHGDVQLYPNPVLSGQAVQLKCDAPDGLFDFDVRVCDIYGKAVICTSTNNVKETLAIITDCLCAGTYYVSVQMGVSGKYLVTKTLVVY